MTKSSDILSLGAANIMATYGPRSVALVRGEGARVWDADGKAYLDFLSGISVVNVGHCHPAVVKAIQAQAEELKWVRTNVHWEEVRSPVSANRSRHAAP